MPRLQRDDLGLIGQRGQHLFSVLQEVRQASKLLMGDPGRSGTITGQSLNALRVQRADVRFKLGEGLVSKFHRT